MTQDDLMARMSNLRQKLDKLPTKVLAKRLKAQRYKRGVSMATIAKAVGINSPQAYAYYEQGTYKPRPDLLVRLAEALGVRPEWLVRAER